jgi:MFS superfamily sulfate permease-like transporter
MAALGAANVAAAISQGFAISGADSRTAMNDAAGGRTQVAGMVAATTVALVLVFLTGPLQYVPVAALGAVLVMAAWSLVDIATVGMLWRESKGEFAISLIATLGVVVVGSIDAILFAVVLALLRFVRIVARPPFEVLGEVAGLPGFHSIERHPGATTIPGICLFRFNSPVVFFNAPYFTRAALQAAAAAGPELRWFVLDAVPITSHDATGRHTLREFERELAARGVQVALAGRQTEFREWREARGLDKLRPATARWFPTLRRAVRTLQKELAAGEKPPPG